MIFDYELETFEEPPRKTSKIILFLWAPDVAPIRKKIPFATSKSSITASFEGIQKDIQLSDLSLILEEVELRKECLK